MIANFEWALTQMKLGKRVRRNNYRGFDELRISHGEEFITDSFPTKWLQGDDILAEDWELVNTESEGE